MTRKEKVGAAMALIKHFVCDRFGIEIKGDCDECSVFLADTYGIENRCPFTDLQMILGRTPPATLPVAIPDKAEGPGDKK